MKDSKMSNEYDPGLQPKPTTYRNIETKSRLEAKWAVFLDHHPNVTSWSYEPGNIKLVRKDNGKQQLSYLPDFQIIMGNILKFILEIKPVRPNEAYVKDLVLVATTLKTTIIIAYGPFFIERDGPRRTPEMVTIYPNGTIDHDESLLNCGWFHPCMNVFDFACRFRFDLASIDYIPPRKGGCSQSFQQVVREYHSKYREYIQHEQQE